MPCLSTLTRHSLLSTHLLSVHNLLMSGDGSNASYVVFMASEASTVGSEIVCIVQINMTLVLVSRVRQTIHNRIGDQSKPRPAKTN